MQSKRGLKFSYTIYYRAEEFAPAGSSSILLHVILMWYCQLSVVFTASEATKQLKHGLFHRGYLSRYLDIGIPGRVLELGRTLVYIAQA